MASMSLSWWSSSSMTDSTLGSWFTPGRCLVGVSFGLVCMVVALCVENNDTKRELRRKRERERDEHAKQVAELRRQRHGIGSRCNVFKVIMLGDSGVGKTCLVARAIDRSQDQGATIAAAWYQHIMHLSPREIQHARDALSVTTNTHRSSSNSGSISTSTSRSDRKGDALSILGLDHLRSGVRPAAASSTTTATTSTPPSLPYQPRADDGFKSNREGDVKFELWDTHGSERYHAVPRLYSRDASACILCVDHRRDSWNNASQWAQMLMEHTGQVIPMILAHTKSDLPATEQQMSEDEAQHFAANFCMPVMYMRCSAKTGFNVTTLVRTLAARLYVLHNDP